MNTRIKFVGIIFLILGALTFLGGLCDETTDAPIFVGTRVQPTPTCNWRYQP